METKARKVGFLFLWLFLAGAILGCLVPVDEPVITVPGDFPTIQAAIEAAEDGDVIVVEPGTYRENIDFRGKAITVRSTAPDDPEVVAATIIDGSNNGPVVTFRTGETAEAVLTGFTITGGSGTWKLIHLEFEGRKEEFEGYVGGGILVAEGSSPTIENNTITGNTAELGQGGGIAVMNNSSPSITGNTIADNEAGFGGAISVVTDSSPAITGNTITGNWAFVGGGIVVMDNSSPPITGNTITGHWAAGGGGIAVMAYSSPPITANTITDNEADSSGGGIAVWYNSSPTITGNTIADNTSSREGGGVAVGSYSSPTIAGNIIRGNTAEFEGGGITVRDNSSSAITGNTFTGNTAERGGALWVSRCSTLHLKIPDDNIYRDNVPDNIYYQ